jgi:hypothetical protein
MKAKRTKSAPKTRKRKADDPEQYERFREMARAVETDENPEAFDRLFGKIVPAKTGRNSE